jgi:hypothetical protein
MKTCLFKLTLIASGAMLASVAFAQSNAPLGDVGSVIALKTPAGAGKPHNVTATSTTLTPSVAANGKAAMPTSGVRAVIAASSVLASTDGIVDNAALPQIQPPAPGFMYER